MGHHALTTIHFFKLDVYLEENEAIHVVKSEDICDSLHLEDQVRSNQLNYHQ